MACTRIEWAVWLKDFPDELLAELLPQELGDLTAMCSYAHMMASDLVRRASITEGIYESH